MKRPEDPPHGMYIVVAESPDIVGLEGRLTDAEIHVARLVYRGLSDREIAAVRRSSVRTVANQLRRIFAKLEVSSRFELVALLARRAAEDDTGGPSGAFH